MLRFLFVIFIAVGLSGCGDEEEDRLPNGATCSVDSDCESYSCSQSKGGDWFCYGHTGLGGSCGITQDCAKGFCSGGVCSLNSLSPNGATCSYDTQCKSGNCAESVGGTWYCYGHTGPGGYCSITQDCAQAVCVNYTCTRL